MVTVDHHPGLFYKNSVFGVHPGVKLFQDDPGWPGMTPYMSQFGCNTVYTVEKGFQGNLLHIFFSTTVLKGPDAVKVVVISLSFQSSTLLFINQSNSLVTVLPLILPLFGMLSQMRFRASLSLASFRKQLKTYLYTRAYPP